MVESKDKNYKIIENLISFDLYEIRRIVMKSATFGMISCEEIV